MEYKNYFYECSKQDLCKIFNVKKIENTKIHSIIHFLEDRGKSAIQADYNKDFKKSFSDAGWKKEVQVSKDTHIGMTCDFQKTSMVTKYILKFNSVRQKRYSKMYAKYK